MSTGRVVVLGAHGFIGRHTCRALAARGLQVCGLGHGSWNVSEWSAWGLSRWIQGDIDAASLAATIGDQPAHLFIHCAGSGTVSHSYAAPFDDYQRSVATTAALLEFVRARCPNRPRVVLASSAAVYGDHGEVDLAEAIRRSPVSPYGLHKLMAEDLCDEYSKFFGLRISVVRLFSVYGEELRKQLLWDAANKFALGNAQFFGTGRELRDWLHVDDAAELLIAAGIADAQAHFELYNGGGSQATTSEVLVQLGRLLGHSSPPIFNGETHIGNPRRLTANGSHAQCQLGWMPRVDLEQGLRRYARWFCESSAR